MRAAADFDDVEGVERGELRGGTGPADGAGVRRWVKLPRLVTRREAVVQMFVG